jgi:hypothetical protein
VCLRLFTDQTLASFLLSSDPFMLAIFLHNFLKSSVSAAFFSYVCKYLWVSLHILNLAYLKMLLYFASQNYNPSSQ